jgi:hypothetical protein
MTRSQRLHRWPLIWAIPLLLGSWPVVAQDDEPLDRTPQDCLSLASVDSTRALDDQTILFYMRGGRAYRNYLPRKCPGLERENRFMYESRGGRLCSIDTVTVLEQWGGRLERGQTCGLGEFHPLSREETEELENLADLADGDTGRGWRRNRNAERPSRDAIEAQPAELPVPAKEAEGDSATAPADAED